MPLFIIYLLKFSISIAVVYLFYQLLLRRLTFYNYNRWYLFGYSIVCFFIPFINISSFVDESRASASPITSFIPSIEKYMGNHRGVVQPINVFASPAWDKWDWMMLILLGGACLLLLRFCVQFISFLRLRKKARLISGDGMNVYHVDEPVIPFSFGNSVFINSHQHSEAELQEIVRHEFVHVKQRHTIDIIWGEVICMFNWYNPFAWLLKAAIRQNLEFIADNKVVKSGIDKKEYQYLLLKVIGNNEYSIAPKFNFSSLKKRIAMMNKLKTARVHLIRFLFVLPLLTVLLISFRSRQQTIPDNAKQFSTVNETVDPQQVIMEERSVIPPDTVPVELNEKGYSVRVVGNKANATVLVKDKDGKTVASIPYSKWKADEKYYYDKYGSYPPPPTLMTPPTPPMPPDPIELPENVVKIDVSNKKATVTLKDGTEEKYDLNNAEEKRKFEKKYTIPAPPKPPLPPPNKRVSMVEEVPVTGASICDNFEITETKAIMHLKNGRVEEYDLTDPSERKKFENKYGRLIAAGSNERAVEEPIAVVGYRTGVNVIADDGSLASVIADDGNLVSENEVLVRITNKTTQPELEVFVRQMKDKGYELKFDNTKYKDGILVHVDGTMKYKNKQTSFSATDFSRLTLSRVNDGDRVYFQVDITERKVI